jgi:hypothetical protein
MEPLIARFEEFGVQRGRSADGELLLKGAAWELSGKPDGWSLELLAPLPLESCPPHGRSEAGSGELRDGSTR